MALLEINHLSKRFGGLIAVNDLTFHVNEGEVLGLIGPNGAGKTTVFNMISGTLRPTTGTIAFNGHDIHGLVANRIARHGIVRTFQLTNLFGDMTVIENVILGSHHKSEISLWGSLFNTPSARRKEQYSTQEAEHLLDFLGLSDQREVLAKNLTHGQQRRLEIAADQILPGRFITRANRCRKKTGSIIDQRIQLTKLPYRIVNQCRNLRHLQQVCLYQCHG